MSGSRRLSQAISEGDGISVLVEVLDTAGARSAEEQGADGLVVRGSAEGVHGATQLPVLVYGAEPRHAVGADAVVLAADDEEALELLVADADELGLECVVRVHGEDDVERALEALDPEIFLLTPELGGADEDHLERLLELLPDVPAGKLAIAELARATREEIEELERAGIDAVVVAAGGDVGLLVGDEPPEV